MPVAADWPHIALTGAFLAMAGFGGLLAVALRDRAFGWYAGIALSYAALAALAAGALSTAATHRAHGVVTVAEIIAISSFLLTYFHGNVRPKGARRIIWTLAAVDVIGHLMTDFGPGWAAAAGLDLMGRYAYAGGLLVVGTGVARAGAPDAVPVLVAFALGAVGVGCGDLATHGLVPAVFEPAGLALVAIGTILLAAGLGDRVRASERAAARMEKLAHVDGLTGIPNRMALDERIADEWDRARRSGTSLAALMADVDHFKSYNDSYGHKAGDDVLRTIARSVAAGATRRDDFAARYGGEEFMVLLPATDLAGATEIAERIRSTVAALDVPHEGAAHDHVTISLGAAAIVPRDGATAAELIARADAAMYRAKQQGRNRVVADDIAAAAHEPAASAG